MVKVNEVSPSTGILLTVTLNQSLLAALESIIKVLETETLPAVAVIVYVPAGP